VLQSQTLANRALGIFDFPIYTISGNVHKTRREIRNKSLKPQLLLQFGVEIRFGCYDHIQDLGSGKSHQP
jgi:hypothetical protein